MFSASTISQTQTSLAPSKPRILTRVGSDSALAKVVNLKIGISGITDIIRHFRVICFLAFDRLLVIPANSRGESHALEAEKCCQ